jgi:serine/threonine-protein kinase
MSIQDASQLNLNELFAGRYRVEALLGQGGMGAVYRAHDELLDEDVALKIAADAERFARRPGAIEPRREVLLARRVTHPNVARVFDLGVADGRLFITMELVPGSSLRRQRADITTAVAAAALMQQVASGLAAAHDAGVLHLDLKPENILVVPGPHLRAVVIDFGIARALGAHSLGVGTLDYMAPEQVEDIPLDGAADVYACGLLLYELLDTHWPFPGDDALQRFAARRKAPPRPLPSSTPAPLAALVMACLARAPRERPTMREVETALTRWLVHGSGAAPEPEVAVAPRRMRVDVGALPGGLGARVAAARRRLSSPAHVAEALAELEDVLVVEPALDVALAVRAIAAVRMWNLASDDPTSGDRAASAVAEAIARAPHIADSHVADALIADATGNHAWTIRALTRAIDRDPLNVWAHATLARIELETATAGEERALFAAALDPEHVAVLELIARERLLAGRPAAAEAMLARIEALPIRGHTAPMLRTRAALWAGDVDAAGALAPYFHDVRAGAGPLFGEAIRLAQGALDPDTFVARGEAMLAAAVSPRRRAFLHQLIAEFVARVRPELALDHVARAASLPFADRRWLDACPTLAGLRGEVAFAAARARVVARIDRARSDVLGRGGSPVVTTREHVTTDDATTRLDADGALPTRRMR